MEGHNELHRNVLFIDSISGVRACDVVKTRKCVYTYYRKDNTTQNGKHNKAYDDEFGSVG